jgi:tetratricopeptide (TPR) repeat protein
MDENQSNKPVLPRKTVFLPRNSPRDLEFPLPHIFLSASAIFGDNWRIQRACSGAKKLEHRFTTSEVERMMGISRRDLNYWTRLRLVLPRARWGERFFNFSDLVALETIKRLAAHRVPAGRIRRAIAALETELGSTQMPLSKLRISTNGKQVVVQSHAAPSRPYEPLTGQFVLNFETSELANKIRAMQSRSAEEWFELGMTCDSNAASLEQASEAYRKAIQAAPEWVEAHINLGTTLYQMGRMEEAREEFTLAVEFEPNNALAEFNLGCVLEQLGRAEDAVLHLLRSVELAPELADAHLNLALVYEKNGNIPNAIRHLSLYLRYEPNGAWAEFARSRIARHRAPAPSSPGGKLTPFRRRK